MQRETHKWKNKESYWRQCKWSFVANICPGTSTRLSPRYLSFCLSKKQQLQFVPSMFYYWLKSHCTANTKRSKIETVKLTSDCYNVKVSGSSVHLTLNFALAICSWIQLKMKAKTEMKMNVAKAKWKNKGKALKEKWKRQLSDKMRMWVWVYVCSGHWMLAKMSTDV